MYGSGGASISYLVTVWDINSRRVASTTVSFSQWVVFKTPPMGVVGLIISRLYFQCIQPFFHIIRLRAVFPSVTQLNVRTI